MICLYQIPAGLSARGTFAGTGNSIATRNGEVADDPLGFVAADNLSPQKVRIL